MRIRRALISVSDKTGLLEFARGLRAAGVEIVATGRSAEALRAASIPVRGIEELTQQPEILGGRVKTLAYQVFSGILYRRGHADDERDIAPLGDLAIDLVAVNFYPFEEAVRSGQDVLENIDIGGPSLVRAAAKNSAHVLVVTDPGDYAGVVEKITARSSLGEIAIELAHKAWRHVADYDHAIASHFGATLRYGENPHQPAKFVGQPIWNSLTPNAISFSNAVDLSAAVELLFSLQNSATLKNVAHAAVVVKHAGPCGVAMAPSQEVALRLAWEGDPVSAFGGVIALSHPLTQESATFLKERFFEALAAPELKGSTALASLLGARKKLKAIDLPQRGVSSVQKDLQTTQVLGGFLTQLRDHVEDGEVLSAPVHGGSVSEADRRLLLFAMHCAASLKSNAIAIARETEGGLQLMGTGQGQPNRIEALQWLAIPRARRVGTLENAAIASDGFFPFPDSIEAIADAGMRLVAQPGGSVQDPQVIAAAETRQVRMVLTGKRHFKH